MNFSLPVSENKLDSFDLSHEVVVVVVEGDLVRNQIHVRIPGDPKRF